MKILQKNWQFPLKKILGILIFTIAMTSLFYRTNSSKEVYTDKAPLHNKTEKIENPENIVVFALVICEGSDEELNKTTGPKIGGDILRQIEQASTLIKSAVALTDSFLRFIIVCDTERSFDMLHDSIANWPSSILQKLELIKEKSWYPDSEERFRTMFRVCATERLFLPHILSEEDSVIYLDTDMVFMHPPEELWNHFDQFSTSQVSALAPNLNLYDQPSITFPYYGETGLNSGLWLMKLSGLRAWPGGWIAEVKRVYEKHHSHPRFKHIDQDIANIIFSENPESLYELSCIWNFRSLVCRDERNRCKAAEEIGVALLHGNGLAFYNEQDFRLKRIYEAWKNFEFERPLQEFVHQLKLSLRMEGTLKKRSFCSKLNNFQHFAVKGLENIIERL